MYSVQKIEIVIRYVVMTAINFMTRRATAFFKKNYFSRNSIC